MKNISSMTAAIIMMLCLIICACGGSPGSAVTNDDLPDNTEEELPEPKDVIDLSDAIAFVRVGNSLAKITTDGEYHQYSFIQHYSSASTISIADDGNLYISFIPNLEQDECTLARFSKNGDYLCISRDKFEIVTYKNDYDIFTPTIQLDGDGNIYYSEKNEYYGFEALPDIAQYDMSSASFLYYSNYGRFNSFLIQEDGTFYIYGYSDVVDSRYFGSYDTFSGDDEGITINGDLILSLFEMPDGNVYYGMYSGLYRAIDKGADSELYIGSGGIGFDTIAEGYVSPCPHKYEGFCSSNGGRISAYYENDDGDFYVISGYRYHSSLWQYWPEVKPIDTSVYRPARLAGDGNRLFIAGTDEDEQNILVSYDVDEGTETIIMSDDVLEGSGMELSHLVYSSAVDWLIFSGKDMADDTYVIGIVDLSNGNEVRIIHRDSIVYELQAF